MRRIPNRTPDQRAADHGSAGGEYGRVARKIIRSIMRLLDHLQRFKMLPVGMRGIGDAAVEQRVGEQQVAEFVADHGDVGEWSRGSRRARRSAIGDAGCNQGRRDRGVF